MKKKKILTTPEEIHGLNREMAVYAPDHYTRGLPCEAIEIIESVVKTYSYEPWQAFCVGNALKYLLRSGKKDMDPREDLLKAANYAHRAATGEWMPKGGGDVRD